MEQKSITATKPRPAKIAAMRASACRRRSLFFRRFSAAFGSLWAWGIVCVVALYLGFYYSPQVVLFKFEVSESPGLTPEFPSPTRHFRLFVRNAEGKKVLPAGFQANNIHLSWTIVPHIPERLGKKPITEVHDLGEGEFLVAFRIWEGVPRGHSLRLKASYHGRHPYFSVDPIEFTIKGPIHEPSCVAPVVPYDWTTAMGCPRSFPQLAKVSSAESRKNHMFFWVTPLHSQCRP